ncbi:MULTISPECIES: TRAP transporter small permease [Alphaproteobacteria]|uniref:TRAP transporter small permease n=1 Tax=Alphaproteobacteria TaxID=28211 RepID=UPI0019D4021D|nr:MULTISPECIES: TRAP transporter small permease [Alphaproteobacteria]MBN7755246.1 TRAP transporter small permease [Nitratireductor aquimarinus]MBY6020028.1 TRAP transporter small permease [Nitratireductor sp. DP7N14-4]MBY5998000.1 TRAP transporter small permease [Tritonibacter mobilis]MCV0380344.1 TRAP transporter small permease [Nitratireductor sp.]MDJ1463602.1 TRAP transporter small permease [Nitratireductor sp. GZWM139]
MNDQKPIDLARPLRIAVGLMLIVVVGVTLLQIILRYFFNAPLVWSEELAKLLIVWIAFIGAAAVCWDGRHLNVDVFFLMLPQKARNVVRYINAGISIGFLAILGWTSVKLVILENMQDLSALPLPAGVVRLAATVGAALMILAIIGRIVYVRPMHRQTDPAYGHEDPM